MKIFAPVLSNLVFAGALLAASVPAANAEELFNDAEREEIGKIVRDYLLANPGVLEEVLTALEEQQAAAQSEAQKQAVAANKEAIFNSSLAFVAGNPDGDVTLVEFFDYNCGYCKRMLPAIVDLVESDPKLRLVLKEWPVLGEESVGAARVAIAVKNKAPEKYFDFHSALLAERGRVDASKALEMAESMGMERAVLERAMNSSEVNAVIVESLELGNKLGLRGTPTYVLDDEVLMGAVGGDVLREKIGAIRKNGCEIC